MNELPLDFKDLIRLAKIEAYRHVLELLHAGCDVKELSGYIKACIRLEASQLPKDFPK